MTETQTARPHWQIPKLASDDRVIAGVAGGIAREIGLDPIVVRVAFVTLAVAGGWGIIAYLVAWVVMANRPDDRDGDAGASGGPTPKGRSSTHRLLGFALVVFGLLLLARLAGGGFVDGIVWPVALLGLGLVVAMHRGVGFDRLAPAEADARTMIRVVAGVALVAGGIILAVTLSLDVEAGLTVALVVALVVAGLAVVLAPWGFGLLRDLREERRARIRSEERAEVAAPLHDSVLQTLTLIQRRSTDSEVVSLARGQERDLRNWLFGGERAGDRPGFRVALENELAEIERLHAVPVEVVVVGDMALDDRNGALLAAAREATRNAAQHSGAAKIDVYAEIADDAIDIFVRDQGVGFETDAVDGDRQGISESIVGRMARVGGSATITSDDGTGTEVELTLPGEPT